MEFLLLTELPDLQAQADLMAHPPLTNLMVFMDHPLPTVPLDLMVLTVHHPQLAHTDPEVSTLPMDLQAHPPLMDHPDPTHHTDHQAHPTHMVLLDLTLPTDHPDPTHLTDHLAHRTHMDLQVFHLLMDHVAQLDLWDPTDPALLMDHQDPTIHLDPTDLTLLTDHLAHTTPTAHQDPLLLMDHQDPTALMASPLHPAPMAQEVPTLPQDLTASPVPVALTDLPLLKVSLVSVDLMVLPPPSPAMVVMEDPSVATADPSVATEATVDVPSVATEVVPLEDMVDALMAVLPTAPVPTVETPMEASPVEDMEETLASPASEVMEVLPLLTAAREAPTAALALTVDLPMAPVLTAETPMEAALTEDHLTVLAVATLPVAPDTVPGECEEEKEPPAQQRDERHKDHDNICSLEITTSFSFVSLFCCKRPFKYNSTFFTLSFQSIFIQMHFNDCTTYSI